jgi:glycine cleavage system aminomethyltransferase T
LGFRPDLARRFNGAEALRKAKPPGEALVQLVGDAPLPPGPFSTRNGKVGRVTSSAWSLSRGATVALAWIDVDATTVGGVVNVDATTAEIAREVFPKET